MYSPELLDHFHNPRNVGEIAEPTAVVETSNPVCGDVLKLWTVVQEGKIIDIKFKVQGCVPAVACASWLTESVKSKLVSEAALLAPEDVERGVGGLPPASHHAAVLE